ARADLALLVTDVDQADADLALLAELPATTPRLVIVNKIDLAGEAPREEDRDGTHWLWLSAKHGAGLELLRARLKYFAGAGGEVADGAFSARRRHVQALEDTAVHIAAAAHALSVTRAGELAAEELS